MGPEQSSSNYAPRIEQPAPSVSYENGNATGHETGLEYAGSQNHERQPQMPGEVLGTPLAAVPAALPVPLPQTQTDDNAVISAATPAPLVASDDDLIEKEWVDQAKKIIAETREDPYRREREIQKLQRDYIRKRYGREIGNIED